MQKTCQKLQKNRCIRDFTFWKGVLHLFSMLFPLSVKNLQSLEGGSKTQKIEEEPKPQEPPKA